MGVPIHHRNALAKLIVDRTLSPKGLSGIFLAATRRTGKTTFVKEDITPYLHKKEVEVMYVDLWADRTRDPGELIRDAIRSQLKKNEGAILKWARRGGLDKVKLYGLEVDINKVGIGAEQTFAEALKQLSAATGRMIVLVVDEAQQALETEAGRNTLFALKAVRDELNGSEYSGFRIIATGSNRDKLSLLVNGKDQAFMGAVLVDLPPLGKEYLEWEMEYYEGDHKPSIEALQEVFKGASNRPEILRKVLDDLAFDLEVTPQNVDEKLREGLERVITDAKQNFLRDFHSLPPLQSAVFSVMAALDRKFYPYMSETVEMYQKECARLTASTVNINESTIQYALDALRTKTLIWSSSRGVYQIEEAQHKEWLAADYRARNAPAAPQLEHDNVVAAHWELADQKVPSRSSRALTDERLIPRPVPRPVHLVEES
jgi:hypothetical protein